MSIGPYSLISDAALICYKHNLMCYVDQNAVVACNVYATPRMAGHILRNFLCKLPKDALNIRSSVHELSYQSLFEK